MLSARLTGINPILTGATDPFLYNPRKSLLVKVPPSVRVHTHTLTILLAGEKLGHPK